MYENYNLKTKDCYIAYFDILGYAETIRKDNTNTALLGRISDCIRTAKTLIGIPTFPNNKSDMEMKVFSDNFFFCTESEHIWLVTYISHLQMELITQGIFIRGAICYGNIFINEDFVYGKGLIDVYGLENKIAIFPRIIIDDSFIVALQKLKAPQTSVASDIESLYASTDFDNNKYVDYLKHSYVNLGDCIAFKDFLLKHKKIICCNLKEEADKSVLQKYNWCRTYHNNFCKKHDFNDYLIN